MDTAEQIQRHETIRQAKAKAIPGKDGTFSGICKLLNDKEFVNVVNRSVQNPKSKEVRQLIAKLENLVCLGSNKVRWSAAQRKSLISNIYAYTNFFGQ